MRDSLARLQHLVYAVERESAYLRQTDASLFAQPFDAARAAGLPTQQALSEQVDAFAMRFGRLQDTLGDKLIPALLLREQEALGSALDNLDRAERLGWLDSADAGSRPGAHADRLRRTPGATQPRARLGLTRGQAFNLYYKLKA